MENYTISEKTDICLGIADSLKNYSGKNGKVNLYNDCYTFVPELKKIFKEYIHGNCYFKGVLHFVEIDKKIDYHFPLTKNHKPLFVIRMKN